MADVTMAEDNRRCTASQFFQEEEQDAINNTSTYDRVVALLNDAALVQRDKEKLAKLKMVMELIVNKDPGLLDNFLDEMLAFLGDKSTEVKKFVVTFMEEASKKDPDILPKVATNLEFILNSKDDVQLIKKAILALSQMYKMAFKWVVKAKTVNELMQTTWQYIQRMKQKIAELIDSDNDGVRTHAIKFLEAVVICLSWKTSDSETPKGTALNVSLDDLPESHSYLKVKKLEEEGKSAFESLIAYMASAHISSVNLMTCMGSMTNIAKQRPSYIVRVVQGFETLHVNLPPTLSKSQVSSVRKNLKMQLLTLLKHPASYELQTPITTLLTDLGATQTEVMKAMPKVDESRKRKRKKSPETSTDTFKKPKALDIPDTPSRVDDDHDDDYGGSTPFIGMSSSSKPAPSTSTSESQKQSAIDITAEDLISRLTPQNVADLVLLSMVMLPETQPAHFQSTYTPIAAAGTQAQIKHLARLLATQLTAAGLGKGIAEIQKKMAVSKKEDAEDDDEDDTPSSPKHSIQTLVGGTAVDKDEEKLPALPPPSSIPPSGSQSRSKGIKVFRLSAVTKRLTQTQIDEMSITAIHRILQVERDAAQGNAVCARAKILTSLVSQFGGLLKDELQDFIFADLRNRTDIALAWIYQEYANYQGYNVSSAANEKPTIASYDECLTRILNGLLERPEQKEGLFSRLLLEAPCITPNAIQILKKYCQEENRILFGMNLLKELILKRPTMKLEFLEILLNFCSHEKSDVRNNAIRVTKKLHERSDLKLAIEKYALYNLRFLLRELPPAELFEGRGRIEIISAWTEDNIKMCLYLYLGLLPINHSLIHELSEVYTATAADIKRTVLRVLETPVKGMGMDSPELLLLVENCPKGAETLVTRIIHILTDKVAPSPALVERVRDLYHKRVSDVRFLIPVLTGLSKKEVLSALPKLIKLNPVVVKEVFNRLLGTHAAQDIYSSPLSPAELLTALHNIDPLKVDMKTIIKATSFCFAEKSIYTQEVLAVVMKSLMEQSPYPTLLMRTVIQSVAMYPKLIGFVMNILQRLITKQVWKQKKVWEGFIKCCERTKPHCFQVLLQLPSPQLKSVFETCPDLREPLLKHVETFTPHQRAHISKSTMQILEKDPLEEQRVMEQAIKAEEERIAAQEKLYQERLEEKRKKYRLILKTKQEQESLDTQNSEDAENMKENADIICEDSENKDPTEQKNIENQQPEAMET